MATQEQVSFALSGCKIYRTAVKNVNLLGSLCEVPDVVADRRTDRQTYMTQLLGAFGYLY